jgi:hypothetical protein
VLNLFNRLVTGLLWLAALILFFYFAVVPLQAAAQARGLFAALETQLSSWQEANATNFLIGQVAVGVVAVLLFSLLLWLDLRPRRPRGARIHTVEGGTVELDPHSIARRLEWHLDQLAEIITVVPIVKARGDRVDIQLEIETAPDVDVPMKTDEVVEVTQDIIEQDMGLKLGKLDVRIRHAPFEPEWLE